MNINDSGAIELSVVMPLYNEAPVIAAVIEEVQRQILDTVEAAELVVIDDCGTDGSAAIVAKISAADARVRLLASDRNRGHGPSVLHGFDEAAGRWILLLDSDGQIDLDGFAALWAARESADLVAGIRLARDDPRHRLILTRFVNVVTSVLAGRRVPDANAGCKLVNRRLYTDLRPSIPDDTFAPSLMLVIGAQRTGARCAFVGVDHRARRSGPSSLRVGRLARAVGLATAQSIAFRWRLRTRSDPP